MHEYITIVPVIIVLITAVVLMLKKQSTTPEDANQQFNLGSFGGAKGTRAVAMLAGVFLLHDALQFAQAIRTESNSQGSNPHVSITSDDIDEPRNEGFIFLRDDSVVDLRGRDLTNNPLLAGIWPVTAKSEKKQQVILTNTMRVRKTKTANDLPIVYHTSGTINGRCLTHKCSVLLSRKKDGIHSILLRADVRDVPVGGEFDIQVEVEYVNAFEGPGKQWYGTYSNDQEEPETLSATLIFPSSKPYKTCQVYRGAHTSATRQLFSGTNRIVPGEDNQTFHFEVLDAKRGESYQLEWQF